MARTKSKSSVKNKVSRGSKKNQIDMEDDFYQDDLIFNNRSKSNNSGLQIQIKSKFKNKKQKDLYNTILENRITFVTGSAGTGKTYVTLMAALECLKTPSENINQIIITKPIVEASQSIGFLPGTMDEKISVYMFSFYSNLKKLIGQGTANELKRTETIKEVPLNYMRGNTFGTYDTAGNPLGAFCILDEAQNCTIRELKTFISRMGEGSKLVIMGDVDQTDLKLKGEKSGLEDAFSRFQGINGVGFIEFTEDDIVRDPFLIEIMKRYKNNEE